MSELLPCPFCGGKPTAIETHPGRGELYCGKCDLVMCGDNAKTPEELTQAWNTRHVETCHDKNGFDESLGFECTVCRTMVDSYMQTTSSDKREQFHYCPFCGRKVEG